MLTDAEQRGGHRGGGWRAQGCQHPGGQGLHDDRLDVLRGEGQAAAGGGEDGGREEPVFVGAQQHLRRHAGLAGARYGRLCIGRAGSYYGLRVSATRSSVLTGDTTLPGGDGRHGKRLDERRQVRAVLGARLLDYASGERGGRTMEDEEGKVQGGEREREGDDGGKWRETGERGGGRTEGGRERGGREVAREREAYAATQRAVVI
eukprot:2537010-Rhodomonas_salina.4